MESSEVSGAYGNLERTMDHRGQKFCFWAGSPLDSFPFPGCIFFKSILGSIEKYFMLTEKMLHGRAKTSAKRQNGYFSRFNLASKHLMLPKIPKIPYPKLCIIYFSIVPLVVLCPILYLTLRSSSSLTVQNLHRRSKFTQITGRLGEFFSEKHKHIT